MIKDIIKHFWSAWRNLSSICFEFIFLNSMNTYYIYLQLIVLWTWARHHSINIGIAWLTSFLTQTNRHLRISSITKKGTITWLYGVKLVSYWFKSIYYKGKTSYEVWGSLHKNRLPKNENGSDFKNFDFSLSHFIHAFCLFTSIYNVLLNYASATAVF
jgi:hypothetical protein